MQYHRRVIRISADDSPNVKEARRLLAAEPGISHEELSRRSLVIPGILTWDEYQQRRATWDPMRQSIGLDARFWRGAEVRLFPDSWFENAEKLARGIVWKRSGARWCLGVDAAEGGDNTAWVVAGEQGCPFMRSKKTPDTENIPGETIALMREWNVDPEGCGFDRGGGGYQHARTLRSRGYPVRTVAFGERAVLEPKRSMTTFPERVESREEGYVYRNRRAEIFHELANDKGFAIPHEILHRKRADGGPGLRDQLAKFPLLIDDNGRYWLPSKGVVTDEMRNRGVKTLTEIIGCSPDEADALGVAHWVLKNPQRRARAGAA